MECKYKTKMVCSTEINFTLDGDVVRNVRFTGGCNGNLKAVSKLVDGMTVAQIQEKLTEQIADAVMENLQPKGVLVIIEAEHMCMSMRGIKKPGTKTMTYIARGVFEEDDTLCDRVFRMIKK